MGKVSRFSDNIDEILSLLVKMEEVSYYETSEVSSTTTRY